MILPLQVLSEGCGVQSTTIDVMSDRGIILPRPDVRIFADTKDEPKKVYDWIKILRGLTQTPFVEVSKGSLMDDALEVRQSKKSGKLYLKGLIPAFVLNPDGTKGLLGRKCTADYKIEMIVRHTRKMIGKKAFSEWRKKHRDALKTIAQYGKLLRAHNKAKKEGVEPLPPKPIYPYAAYDQCQGDPLCVMWIGISTDEADRMKPSPQPWIKTRWPLIEMGMSRDDCLTYLDGAIGMRPPRSACKKCPFHSDDEWIRQRDEEPEEFAESVAWERKLIEAAKSQEQLKGIPYLHESCVPLDQVKFVPTAPGYRQLNLFAKECTGLCGT